MITGEWTRADASLFCPPSWNQLPGTDTHLSGAWASPWTERLAGKTRRVTGEQSAQLAQRRNRQSSRGAGKQTARVKRMLPRELEMDHEQTHKRNETLIIVDSQKAPKCPF